MCEQANSGRSPRVERGLETLFGATAPDTAFVASLEQRLVARRDAQSVAQASPLRRFWARIVQPPAHRRWATVALSLLLVLTVAVVAIGPQQVWAGLQQLLGYVPGLGFVNLEQAYMLAEPVEVRQESVVLRVEQVVASPERTIVAISSVSLPPEGQPWPTSTWYEYGQAYSDFQAFLRLPDGSRLEVTAKALRPGEGTLAFPPLPADAEIEQITLELPRLPLLSAGAAPENWVVPLILHPVTEEVVADLGVQVYALPDASDTHEGITLRVLEVAQWPEETSLYVQVEWDPGMRVVVGWPVTLWNGGVNYSMRDSHGDSPVAFHDRRVLFGQQGSPMFPTVTTYEDIMWTFGPAWRSAQSLTLQMNWFGVNIPTTEVSFTVDLGDDPQVGDQWPLDVHLTADGFPVHITSVRLVEPSVEEWGPDAAWKLIFETEPVPEREDGRLLQDIWLYPLLEDGVLACGARTSVDLDPLQSYVILEALPEGPIPVRASATVRVPGPWTVTWAIPGADEVGE